jgi:hypothetical protein
VARKGQPRGAWVFPHFRRYFFKTGLNQNPHWNHGLRQVLSNSKIGSAGGPQAQGNFGVGTAAFAIHSPGSLPKATIETFF